MDNIERTLGRGNVPNAAVMEDIQGNAVNPEDREEYYRKIREGVDSHHLHRYQSPLIIPPCALILSLIP